MQLFYIALPANVFFTDFYLHKLGCHHKRGSANMQFPHRQGSKDFYWSAIIITTKGVTELEQ